MLVGTSLNDLLQLDADLQMLRAALAQVLANAPALPGIDPLARLDATRQRVLDLIDGEASNTVSSLQARLKLANDTIRKLQQGGA